MKLFPQKSVKEIADLLDITFVGDGNIPVEGLNEIHRVEPGDIVFVDHPKYYEKALKSAATIVLINKEVELPEGKALLLSDDPFRDFNRLSSIFSPFNFDFSAASARNDISDSCRIDDSVRIAPNVKFGENVIIYPNVTIYNNVEIGNDVIIHAGSTIGGHAFYYKNRPEGMDRLLTCGGVRIEDKVEIGACSTVDAGVTALTIIGRGTKIDNLVQVGHDTIVGKNCILAAQVGLAGCVEVQDGVKLWGQVGVASDIVIGENAELMAQTGVNKSLEGNLKYFGTPVGEAGEKMREIIYIRKLPELFNAKDK